jgi:hypothetical protein
MGRRRRHEVKNSKKRRHGSQTASGQQRYCTFHSLEGARETKTVAQQLMAESPLHDVASSATAVTYARIVLLLQQVQVASQLRSHEMTGAMASSSPGVCPLPDSGSCFTILGMSPR